MVNQKFGTLGIANDLSEHQEIRRIRRYIRSSKKAKLKQSRNRPGVDQRVPGILDSQNFKTLGT